MLKVYAIVLNYNSSEETVSLYRNLSNFNLKHLSIYVIDNNSDGKEREVLRKNIPVKCLVLNDKNLGYARGNNVGIELAMNASADYIWLLNPDIRIEKDTLPILLETLTAKPYLAAIGPRILHRTNPSRIFTDGELILMDAKCTTIHKNFDLEATKVSQKIDFKVDYIDGSCILLNCQAIKELGKLSEEYFLYFEETDWCFNAKKNNWQLAVNSNALAYNLTSEKGGVFHYYFMRNKLIFAKKHLANYKSIEKYYIKKLIQEIKDRFCGIYLRPYFKSRLKGLISGILFTRF